MRIVPAVLALALLVAGCTDKAGPATAEGKVAVVATTDVYADIVKQIGGDRVDVTTLITGPDVDPHSFEASTQIKLAVSKAKLVVKNGGGYDAFVDEMIGDGTRVVDAFTLAGLSDGQNEHVWYDPARTAQIAVRVKDALAEVDADGTAGFDRAVADLQTRVAALTQRAAALRAKTSGKSVAMTEPVPQYLLEACGLVDKTPEAFLEAVEEESDVPVAALSATVNLVKGKQLALLAYNRQTETAQTKQVRSAAQQAGVPVVEFTETLPAGKDYVTWMGENLTAIEKALG